MIAIGFYVMMAALYTMVYQQYGLVGVAIAGFATMIAGAVLRYLNSTAIGS